VECWSAKIRVAGVGRVMTARALTTHCGRSSVSEQTFDGPHEPPPRRCVPRAGNSNHGGSDVVAEPDRQGQRYLI
jgi:hypothetical protein